MPIENEALVILILASGKGQRFRAAGGTTHKLDADLEGQTVLQRTREAAQASGLHLYTERQEHPGMGEAIASAVRANGNADGWLILPADMPLVLPETIRQIADALRQGAVAAQPMQEGRRGHPVGFSKRQRGALLALQGDEGARSVLVALRGAGEVEEVETRDAGIFEDIDTPADLARARLIWQARAKALSASR